MKVLVLGAALATLAVANAQSLPIVNLGYNKQQATAYNSTGDYYQFSNIRYAAPPVGANRWRPPRPPAYNATVQTGSEGQICTQAHPAWPAYGQQWYPTYLAGGGFDESQHPASYLAALNASVPQTLVPNGAEDCLFLDVYTPSAVFHKPFFAKGAPVLVWIHGGGQDFGTKNSANPSGLINQAGSEGIVFVAIDYRLGAFGWLGGNSFQSSGGIANAGLYDQHFALKWIRKYIHRFGGDPHRVTVMGESAGAADIMHQLTAYGGARRQPKLFQRAILQSPAFIILASNPDLNFQFETFLKLSNVTTLAEAQNLPTEVLQLANIQQVYQSSYGNFKWGPSVDGVFVPALPGKLLLEGKYDHNVQVLVGHNSNEGLIFTNPLTSQDESGFASFINTFFPTANASTIAYIQSIYPLPSTNAPNYTYTDGISRQSFTIAESTITCNSYYLTRAFQNSWAYEFAIPPGLHAADVPYSFYNGGAPASGFNATVAVALQQYITSFAQGGPPKSSLQGLPPFLPSSGGQNLITLNVSGITSNPDPTYNSRCAWWQNAYYVPS